MFCLMAFLPGHRRLRAGPAKVTLLLPLSTGSQVPLIGVRNVDSCSWSTPDRASSPVKHWMVFTDLDCTAIRLLALRLSMGRSICRQIGTLVSVLRHRLLFCCALSRQNSGKHHRVFAIDAGSQRQKANEAVGAYLEELPCG